MTPTFQAKIERGKLFIADREQFDRYIESLVGVVEIIVKPWKQKRTDEQNKYLWGVVYKCLSDWNGNSTEEWHEICKQMFLPPHQVMFERKFYTMRLTTTTKSTKEFAEYVDKIIQFAAEHGVVIPPPERVDVRVTLRVGTLVSTKLKKEPKCEHQD